MWSLPRGSRGAWQVWGALAACSAVVLALAVSIGSVALPAGTLWRALTDPGTVPGTDLQVLQLRVPRVVAAYATGGLLAVSGALMQVLLVNPLADPYILGVSGGAAVGALSLLYLGVSGMPLELGALAGALIALLLVLAPAHRLFRADGGRLVATRLLLTGVVLAAGWSALISLLLTLAPEAALRGMLFWLMGDLGAVQYWEWPLAALLLLLLAVQPLARDLNSLLRGEIQAFSLGVPVARRRLQLYLLASLAAAVAVSTAGTIGFVGLLVPHLVRLLVGNDQRVLLPATALLGGSLLTLADTGARTLFTPAQLPVGVITALIGVPTFLWLLTRRPGS